MPTPEQFSLIDAPKHLSTKASASTACSPLTDRQKAWRLEGNAASVWYVNEGVLPRAPLHLPETSGGSQTFWGYFRGYFKNHIGWSPAAIPLTDTAIRNSVTRGKPYKILDGGGLHLLVNASGSKLWRLKYRFGGIEKLLSIGPYPLVSLKFAREKRDAAKLLLLEDKDPGEERKLARIAAERERAVTFGIVAQEYVRKLEKEGRAAATLKKLNWLVGLTGPLLSARPIAQIETRDILRVLRQVEARGTDETASRLRSTIGSVFRYAIATGRVSKDPTEALKGALIRPQVLWTCRGLMPLL